MTANVDTIAAELRLSGITPEDINARPLGISERSTTGLPLTVEGYVIPYYSIEGKRLPHYRVKAFNYVPKYRQPKDTGNYIYFPPNFMKAWQIAVEENRPSVIITEGEKKAAAAVANGIPACAVGGVDSWRNRTILLSEDTELIPIKAKSGSDESESESESIVKPRGKKEDSSKGSRGQKGAIKVKIGAGDAPQIVDESYAIGFESLIKFVVDQEASVVIVFDSVDGESPYEVQRAAATLGYELRHLGIGFDKIRQIILPVHRDPTFEELSGQLSDAFPTWKPPTPNDTALNEDPDGNVTETVIVNPALLRNSASIKTGLDDFIVEKGLEGDNAFLELLKAAINDRARFPRHPNIKDFINKKLALTRMTRKEAQKIGIALLAELDSLGMRLKAATSGQMYYFDGMTKRLLPIMIASHDKDLVDIGPFGNFLFHQFGLGRLDRTVMGWLAQLIAVEPGVLDVDPHRVIYPHKAEDIIDIQISDGQYLRVTPKAIEVLDNGTNKVMFESGYVDHVDANALRKEIQYQSQKAKHSGLKPWWLRVIKDTRYKYREDAHSVQIATLLFYVSPWLNRWRGTQLPVELFVGESGAGKSTICALRLSVIMGRPDLRNVPSDIRDWHASVIASGGLHVTDNVQFADKNLRQRLSDEICRIVTEPEPHVEMRKLYSTATVARYPVDVVFSFTAIQQPFPNADLINRSIIIELDKFDRSKITYSGNDSQDGIAENLLEERKAESAAAFKALDYEDPDFHVMGEGFNRYGYGNVQDQGQGKSNGHSQPSTAQIGNGMSAQVDPNDFTYGAYWTEGHLNAYCHPSRPETTGRIAWLAHEAIFLQEFLKIAGAEWNPTYVAKHRLMNLEQIFRIASKVFGWDGSWIPSHFYETVKSTITEYDWAMEGLKAWVDLQREVQSPGKMQTLRFKASDIVAWVTANEEYRDCNQLTSSRRLGRYISTHEHQVNLITGIYTISYKQGVAVYAISPTLKKGSLPAKPNLNDAITAGTPGPK